MRTFTDSHYVGLLTLLLSSLAAFAFQSGAHAQALIAGEVPRPGQIALIVLRGDAGPVQVVGELTVRSCLVEALASLEQGTWHLYVPEAPARVNARFPASLQAGQPLFVRCRTGAPSPPAPARIAETGMVVSVTDGDTLHVALDHARTERVRLIGIDTPETGECLAGNARDSLAALALGQRVGLEREVDDRDEFSRLLRHVFVGDVHVNAAQLRAGLATARPIEPNALRASELQTG